MKWFLSAVIVLLITLTQFGCEEDTGLPDLSRPNIIWLVAEDQSPDFFPMYGDSTISLPNLEALANQGVIFNNAYSPVPVCAPARSALITGLYPTTLGTHNMRTYNAYRTDNQPALGIPSYSPIVPQGVKMFTEYLRRIGYYCTNNSKEDYNFRKTEVAWDESSGDAHWRNRPENSPFFSVFNFNVCHESQIWNRGKDELLVSPDSVDVPPYFPDTKEIRHDIAVNYSNLIRLDNQIGEVLKQLREDELYDNSIIFFYGDHGGPFPRHKRALYETGVKVPLVIKFKDNEKENDRDERLISFIDFGPTVLSMAGVDPPKVMQGKAQFGDYAHPGSTEYVFYSADRFDGMVDRLRAVRFKRFKYIKNFNTEISNALPVAYREQMPMMQKLNELWDKKELDSLQSQWFRTPKPEEELYDLEADPNEFINLAEREEFQDTLLHLRNVLKEWIKTTNDLGLYPENELLAKWLPDGEPQHLPDLELEDKGGKINLFNSQTDATIIWKQQQDSTWHFFKDPLPNNISFIAKAVRIGYEDSEILEYEVE